METVGLTDIKFDDKGLVPAVVQEGRSGKVLMVAYMNAESLQKTVESGETWFYSRSRQELWHKAKRRAISRRFVTSLSTVMPTRS